MERRIAYSSPFVPAEWIASFGLRPFRVLPGGGPAGEEGLPRGGCPFAHAFLREVEVLAGRGGIGGVLFATTCDQARRAAEDLDAPGLPVFVFNVPHTWKTPPAHRLYLEELERLGRFLVRLGGKEPGRDTLVETCLAFDKARRDLLEARPFCGAREWALASAAFQAAGEPRPEIPPRRKPTAGVPLALLGGPLWGGHLELYDLVERAGGALVLDGTEWGERTFPAPLRRRFLREDPLLELAGAYFGTLPAPFRRPDSALFTWLSREIPERGIRGILLVRSLFCDFWQVEAARLSEWSSLPVVEVDLAGERGSLERIESRVQALVEVLR